LILGVAHDNCNFEDIPIQEQPVACIVYRYTKTKRGAARGSERQRDAARDRERQREAERGRERQREAERGRERQREAKSEGDAY